MSQHDDAMLAYLRNINTRPGPNAGRSIDPTKPGPTADRITELERRIADYREMIVKAENKDAPLTPLGLQVLEARRAQVEQWEAELARLRNEQPKRDPQPEPQDVREALLAAKRTLAAYQKQSAPHAFVGDIFLQKVHALIEAALAQPVAWRVRDFGDDWILCHSQKQAERDAESAGNLIQPLYTAPHRPDASGLVEAAEIAEREISEVREQIEHNNDYARRSGRDCSAANETCRSHIYVAEKIAKAIRAHAADRSGK